MEVTEHLAAKVAFLKRPDSYPSRPVGVDAVETHMTWVFLTDREAYKLKKPVRYDFLDFSTLEARRHDCEEEFRLNRRLAFSVYFGTVPLVIDRQGGLRLGRFGEPVEWLVKMRRLPANLMLDALMQRGPVNAEAVRAVGLGLADFYRNALPVDLAAADLRRRLSNDIAECRRELLRPEFSLAAGPIEQAAAELLRFLVNGEQVFAERIGAGRVIDAHGDLRPEHVCLESPPVIIDCLEFNRELRILDSASELSFLALECERLGNPNVGETILRACLGEMDDHPAESLLHFYRSYHALVRAKLAVWHLDDHLITEHGKWIALAEHYVQLASGGRTAGG